MHSFHPYSHPNCPQSEELWYGTRALCMVIKCHKAKKGGKRCTCSLPYPWDSPEENTLVRGVTGQPEAYEKKFHWEKMKIECYHLPRMRPPSPTFQLRSNCCRECSFWWGERRMQTLHLLWGRSPLEASVSHSLDHPLFGLVFSNQPEKSCWG